MPFDMNQPQVVAAIVAGGIALTVGRLTIIINAALTAFTTERKLRADQKQARIEKAWADYELRRDIYLDVARQIDCLFETGKTAERPEFHRTARKARLVGSDLVVRALNTFTSSVRENQSHNILEQNYRSFFNAMRQDIRQFHALPPEGTDLGPNAFPIEG